MKDKYYYKLYVLLLIYNKQTKQTNIYFYKICAIVLFYNISTNISNTFYKVYALLRFHTK